MKPRSAIILIQDGLVALIERHRSGRHYFVFPGGKIEAGESAGVAAVREAWEELGLEVSIGRMVAEIWYNGTPQYYFLAEATGGQFGQGQGPEMAGLPGSKKGSHLPVWMPLSEITHREVLPKLMAELVSDSYPNAWPEPMLVVTDSPPDEPG